MTETFDALPLSALNQYAYCPRRCFLIHAEGEFQDNIHTQAGTEEHERVDTLAHEIKHGVRVEFALPVWSDTLGLSGRCDVVEFHPDGTVFPVEYKHGKKKRWINDDLQLAAQAVCLEEMLAVQIEGGAIYHIQSKRRRDVAMTAALRQELHDTAQALHALFAQTHCPPVTTHKARCEQCSLNPICEPELIELNQILIKQSSHLFEDTP